MRRSRSEVAVSNTSRSVPNSLLAQQLSLDIDCLPEVRGDSESLREQDFRRLGECLPARLMGSDWRLVFSTGCHGFSLGSLYRKFQREASSSLIVIEDTTGEVFGALVSCPISESDHFYGTGESFLFTCQPTWHLYSWSGDNQLFVRGTASDLVVGAGEGQFGIWLDSGLFKGRSQSCKTYQNEPLSSQGDFIVKSVECWTFD